MSLMLICVGAYAKIALLFNDKSYSIVKTYHIPFIHLSVHKYLECFYLLAIVNSAAINTSIQVSLWDLAF